MPDSNELQIVLSLDDQASAQAKNALRGIGDEANKSAKSLSAAMEDAGRSLQSVGREVGHVSASLAFLGAGVVAPFVLALNNASKSSIAVSDEMSRLKTVTDEFQSEIAEAVLPVVRQFTDNLKSLLDAFNSLPQPVRDSIAQTILLTGEILLAVAAFGLLSKEIIILIANVELLSGKFLAWIAIPANAWILGVVAALGVLVALMWNFQGVANTVISTFEVLFRYLVTGFDTIKLAVLGMEQVVVDAIEGIISALAKIPGPQQKAFQSMQKSVDDIRLTMQGMASKEMNDIVVQSDKISNVFKTGQGEWSKTFQTVKASAQDFFNSHKKGTDQIVVDTRSAQRELVTLSNQLRDINIANSNVQFLSEKKNLNESIELAKFYQQNWMQAHASIKVFAIDAAQAVKTNLSSAISDIVTGAKTAKEAFAALGQTMLKMVIDYFAQKAISMALDFAFGKAALAANVATQIAAGAAITAAFAPAALVASIASFGGAAIAAAAAMPIAASAEVAALGAVSAAGGAHLSEGTDTVPAMLTPGEMVFPRSMADAIRAGEISVSGKNQSGGNGDITINLNGITINSKENIRQLAEELGFEMKRKLRGARSNL